MPTVPSRRRSLRRFYALGLLCLFGYAGWMLGPYLRSVVVRDAAVTAWTRLATAPIKGRVDLVPLGPDGHVAQDGVVAAIRNEHATREPVERARVARDLAAARVLELEYHIREIMALDDERQNLKALYAATFRRQLDVEIENLQRKADITRDLLVVTRTIADRKTQLAARGAASINDADEAQLRVRSVEFDLAHLEAEVAFASVRRAAADHGVFTMRQGEDPDWVRGSRMELKLEKKQARLQLRDAQAALAHADAQLAAAEEDYERLGSASVVVPAGSVVWSERTVSGATVLEGEPLLEWLDCDQLLVDVPVSDVEVTLIAPGQEATIVLEGETRERQGRVVLTRGSAATLDASELAAVAKGRGPGTAQVLVELPTQPGDFARCPVGQAAFVDFEAIGLIDVILARLRL